MIQPIHLILIVLALLCEALAMSSLVGGESRIRLIAAGLTAYFASMLF